MELLDALNDLPLVAILRGIPQADIAEIADALVGAGFTCIEVPLNRPAALKGISTIAKQYGDHVAVGAGSVLTAEGVQQVIDSGGRFVVMPNTDPAVIGATKQAGLQAMPGFATPTEAFTALAAGADALKLFPAEAFDPSVLKSLKAVLPPEVPILPTGSITPEKMQGYLRAGAGGFGIGSALYYQGASVQEVAVDAKAFVNAYRRLLKEAS